MAGIQWRAHRLAHKPCRSIRMKNYPKKYRRRRVLATIENLENLSFNTRRFLNRKLILKTEEDGKLRKPFRWLARRSLRSVSQSPNSVSTSPSITCDTEDVRVAEETLILSDVRECGEPVIQESTTKEASIKENNRDVGTEVENQHQVKDESDTSCSPQHEVKEESDNRSPQNEAKEESYELRFSSKCQYCGGVNVVDYAGPPPDSRTETDILNLDDLKVSQEAEEDDEIPQYKLTEFNVFDEAGHLCAFDGDLIQNNKQLFFSGYIKPVYEDDPKVEGGYPCARMGPMTEWWISGFDNDEKAVIGFSSELADYYLLQPAAEYASFLEAVTEKIHVTKLVIHFLKSRTGDEENTYEELLQYLELENVTEGKLLNFANFIHEQIFSYDSTADEDETHLMTSPCMQQLAELAGIESTKEKAQPLIRRRRVMWLKKDSNFVKATTTSLVENVFELLFPEQIDKKQEELKWKPCVVKLTRLTNLERYAGSCKLKLPVPEEDAVFSQLERDALKDNIIKPCKVNLKPLRFDELNKYLKLRYRDERNDQDFFSRVRRRKRRTSSDDWDSEEEVEYIARKVRKFNSNQVIWQGESEKIDGRTHFMRAKVGDEFVDVGNFVSMKFDHKVGLVKYMYTDDDNKKLGHLQWFWKAPDTLLKDAGSPQELFMTDACDDIELSNVEHVLDVEHIQIDLNEWRERGNEAVVRWIERNKNLRHKFFYQKRYEPKIGRFQDLPEDEHLPNICTNCSRKNEMENFEKPVIIGPIVRENDEYIVETIRWRGESFKVGSCVFLSPGSLIESKPTATVSNVKESYDEIKYPEKYRKNLNSTRGKKSAIGEEEGKEDPFDIGRISQIFSKKRTIEASEDVCIRVQKYYRPHNTHLEPSVADREDLNKLYWSAEECVLQFDQVEGKCYVSYSKNVELPLEDWSDRGPFRFYFCQAYDSRKKKFIEPPPLAMEIGKSGVNDEGNVPFDWPEIKPLASMDVFAGCGGLSEGLHQSGVAECRWAVEKFHEPAAAFRLNNRQAVVYETDCNDLLKRILKPETREDRKLPKRGEVELLCGGPPCQGFSRMNRYKDNPYSQFKNSLVTTYLSFCDHYRPRFFIMENVRDFISTSEYAVFKLTLCCLLRMGYQVGFGVLQCGKYGIPQSRRRTIILAAAPGEILPEFPEPTHSFPLNTFVNASVNGEKFISNMRWTKSAPYRSVTVNDAISDLPKIANNSNKSKMFYKKEPLTHFQKMMRGENSSVRGVLYDHVCKKMNPLVLKRMEYIPRDPPGDWRDLPNIEVDLPDNKTTKKLQYTHNDWKNPKSKKGQKKGVCACATKPKARCSEDSRQSNTLIPWCLVHTGNRHNHWSGLYGRIPRDSYFRTAVTNPEPMGQQGRVVHPDEDRVISIREYARAQGFRDSFNFFGTRLDKYAQIGNAVAPPLGKAIGLEIRKSISARMEKTKKSPE